MAQHKYNTALAFDFGMKRIGAAVGQTITTQASPLPLLKAKDGIPRWEEISRIIDEWHPDVLVVGLPLNMDNSEQPITHAAKKFANRLKEKFKLPVELMDERLSTIEARRLIFEEKQGSKQAIDSMAATVILEAWFSHSH